MEGILLRIDLSEKLFLLPEIHRFSIYTVGQKSFSTPYWWPQCLQFQINLINLVETWIYRFHNTLEYVQIRKVIFNHLRTLWLQKNAGTSIWISFIIKKFRKIQKLKNKKILKTKLLWTSRSVWDTKKAFYFGWQFFVPNPNSLWAHYASASTCP